MNKFVYLVMRDEGGDTPLVVEGVYETEAKAEEAMQKLEADNPIWLEYWVDEWELK